MWYVWWCLLCWNEWIPDKLDDAKAKAAIRAQIEADKRARAEKAAKEKALREGRAVPEASSSTSLTTPVSATTAASSGTAGRDYKDTRLQIRLASGGQPYTTTLPSDSSVYPKNIFPRGTNFVTSTAFSVAWCGGIRCRPNSFSGRRDSNLYPVIPSVCLIIPLPSFIK